MGNWSRTKVLRLAKGFRGRAKNCYSLAILRLHKSLQQAYRGRRIKRRVFRRDWILRLKTGLNDLRVAYSKFIHGLNVYSNVILDRKTLADLALNEPYSFKAVVEEVVSQAGIPRIDVPKVSYDEAKGRGEILDKPLDYEVPEPQFKAWKPRPGPDDKDDYLRMTHIEEDEKWHAERRKKMKTPKQLKRVQKKPIKKDKKIGEIKDEKETKGGEEKGGEKGGKDKGKAPDKDKHAGAHEGGAKQKKA